MSRLAIAAAFAFILGVALPGVVRPAQATVLVTIDKSAQRMSVVVDGRVRHQWTVSTGLGGGPPSGSFRPQRMERMWHSRRYDWTPMPHSIFFHHGFAIHGTTQVSRLGRPASKGCVRLHPANAATLFELVKRHGMASTRIVVGDGGGRYANR